MNEWKPLNNEQAEALFAQHAMLIGGRDRVPRFVAADLFGLETVKAVQANDLTTCNAFGYGGNVFHYITREGFKACVSRLNCKAMQAQADALDAIERAALAAEDAKNDAATDIASRLHPEFMTLIEKDINQTATEADKAQIDAWHAEAMKLVGTPEGAEILKQPVKQTKKRGRPRKTAG